jgi:amidophosphoribosyltransferase
MIVTYPPVRFPCYAGIDFPSMDELLANQKFPNDGQKIGLNKKISKLIGADKVFYNDTKNLAKAIGLAEEELCFTCSTGNYSSLGITPKFRTREEVKGE